MRPGRRLVLLPVGPIERDPGLLDWLATELEQRLGVRTERGAELPLRPEWLDAEHGQLDSNAVVDALVADGPGRLGATVVWVLAVTEADLFAPGRAFVFGEATLGGAWSLISTARLAGAADDRDHPQAAARARVLGSALHELGHLAALPHCHRPTCVMAPSSTVAAADRRSAAFCKRCATDFRVASGLDPTPAHG
jgi:predicted Zn-dependent protease